MKKIENSTNKRIHKSDTWESEIALLEEKIRKISDTCHYLKNTPLLSIQGRELYERMKKIQVDITRLIDSGLSRYQLTDEIWEYYSFADPTLTVSYENGVYHYVLDDLVPHRTRYDESSGKWRNKYDRNMVISGYRRGVEESTCDFSSAMFDKANPVYLYFIHYFPENDVLLDLDNLDIKPFIDGAISRVVVPDDSPYYVRYIMDYGVGECRHTEVFAGNKEKIKNLL